MCTGESHNHSRFVTTSLHLGGRVFSCRLFLLPRRGELVKRFSSVFPGVKWEKLESLKVVEVTAETWEDFVHTKYRGGYAFIVSL